MAIRHAVHRGVDQGCVESDVLADSGDRYTVTGPVGPLAIPTTLHGSLVARLHRLAHTRSTPYRGDRLTRLNLQIFEEWTSSNAWRALLPANGSTLASCLSSSPPISRLTYRSASAVRGRCRARQRGRLRRSALRNMLCTPLPMSPPP